MRKVSALVIVGMTFAAPIAARPVLQPFGGRAVLRPPSGEGSSGERILLTLRNDGPTEAVYRLVWLDTDQGVIGRSVPGRLAAAASVELDVGGTARSRGVAWNAGTIAVDWASERSSRVRASALRRGPDCGSVSQLTVEEEPPRPMRWAELQAISER